MREGFTGRGIVAAVAAVVLLGPRPAGGQGAWEAPASEKTRKNPVAPGATAVTQGKQVAQSESDGELFWKISNGRGAMPPWKHLSEPDRWAIVHYIRSLRAK